MIDTIKFSVSVSTNKHLYQLGVKENQFSIVQNKHSAGEVVMDIKEYKFDEKKVTFYRWKITNQFGYEIILSSNESYITFSVSLPKWYYGTSYINQTNYHTIKKFIDQLQIKDWTIKRIDFCTNHYFESDEYATRYLDAIHLNFNKTSVRTFKTGLIEYNSSSYYVVYRKDKDPKDLLIDVPIIRYESKLTLRNTYDWRKDKRFHEINETNLLFFLAHGEKRHNKFLKRFKQEKAPTDWIEKSSKRQQKNMYMLLKLYGSFEMAKQNGVISQRTLERYKMSKVTTINVLPTFNEIPSFAQKQKIKNKLFQLGKYRNNF